MIVVVTRQSASPRRKLEHRLLQLALVHLPVRLGEAGLRAPGRAAARPPRAASRSGCGGRRPGRRARPRARSPADQVLVVGADVGADRAAALGRRLDHRDVAQARQAHLQGARDRRRRERQHVDLQLQLAQQLLLLDPEALLLVDDDQAELLGADVAGEQPVGADQDVDLAGLEVGEHRFHLGRLAQAGDALDPERQVGEALAEGAEVLLGEDRGRHQHHHLLAVGGRLDRGPQRDLGLAEADVAADQPVHRPLGLHVALHRLDRLQLVGGLAVGEGRLHRDLPLAVGREGVAPAGAPLGVEVEQLARRARRRRGGRAPSCSASACRRARRGSVRRRRRRSGSAWRAARWGRRPGPRPCTRGRGSRG